MRRPLVVFGLLALVSVAPCAAQATPALPDGVVQSIADNSLAYAKYKGWKGKAVKRRGPPPWAPAHGRRRKLHR